MIQLRNWMQNASRELKSIVTNADQEVSWLVEDLLQKPASFFIAHPDFFLTDEQHQLLSTALDRRLAGEPLAYILGHVSFLNEIIEVKQPCLIPRPETEEWMEQLINLFRAHKKSPFVIADLCTGTGCIAVALGRAFEAASLVAVDIQNEAVSLAQRNVRRAGLQNVEVKQGDFLKALKKHSCDLIVSNPPYLSNDEWQSLDQSVKNWEDLVALTDQADGLAFYRRLAHEGKSYLKKVHFDLALPRIVCEIGYQQGVLIRDLFIAAGWKKVQIQNDLSGKDRWIAVYE
jgi:release factor glutamine methyltransferase